MDMSLATSSAIFAGIGVVMVVYACVVMCSVAFAGLVLSVFVNVVVSYLLRLRNIWFWR